ncbi:hypothetical protein C7Q66_12185 [Staphylococcus aureus]|nr:hypothetical protein C7Q66_12185 [Staphylococcus aureus]
MAGLQHSGIGFPISTDIASWGNGPNTEAAESQLTITCKLAGPQTQKLTVCQLTISCKLGKRA